MRAPACSAKGRALQTLPPRRTTVERAFELARSGACDSLPAIVAALKGEQHDSVDAHLAGPSIRKDLRRAWEAAAA